MKRTLSTSITVCCLALLACADVDDDEMQVTTSSAATAPLPFESNTRLEVLTLDAASCYTGSNQLVPGFTTYPDARSFGAAYLAARPGASQVPSVDFGSYVVVGAVLGQEGGCGAKLEVVSATNRSEQVEVALRSGNAGCAITEGTSYAFAFVRVNRLEKEYVAVEVSGPSEVCPSTVPVP